MSGPPPHPCPLKSQLSVHARSEAEFGHFYLRGMTTACPPLVFPLCLALPDSIPYYQGKMIGLYLNFREK